MADIEIGKMKVAELREACTERGLSSSGTKSTLVARLEEAVQGSGGGTAKRKAEAEAQPATKKEKVARPPQVTIGKKPYDLSPDGELLYLGKPPKNTDEMRKLLQGIDKLGNDWVKTLTFPYGLNTGTGAFLCDCLLRGSSITGLKIQEEFGENCSDAEDKMCAESIGRLLQAERLELLDLSGVWLSDAIDALADGIASSSRLQDLYLNRCSLVGGSAAAKVLEAVLRKPGGLNRLELSQCAFRGHDRTGMPAGPPLVALVESGKLVHLNMSNAHGDPATTIGLFASVASGGSRLQSLSMHDADMSCFSVIPPMVPGQRPAAAVPSDDALAAVADAIGRSPCLRELDVGNCQPLGTDEVAAKIAQSLKNSSSSALLRKLSLTGLCPVVVGRPDAPIVAKPGIGKAGLEALLDAVDAAPQLQQLEVTLHSRHGLPKDTVEMLKAHKKFVCDI